MRVLYFDCFSGAAGDMILGALLDAGLPFAELRGALGNLLPAGSELAADRVVKAGVSATRFRLLEPAATGAPARTHRDHEHEHAHTHSDSQESAQSHGPRTRDQGLGTNNQGPRAKDQGLRTSSHGLGTKDQGPRTKYEHRTVAEIQSLIGRSNLSATAKQRTSALFDRLAEAEAAVHQIPVDRVHLHEVGALDSIVDIAGTVFGLEWFGADRIVSSPLNVGGGTVACAHGDFPVPAPATLRLLQGVPVYSAGADVELVTPTGALLVAGYAASFGPLPPMTIERSGYGAGNRELPGRPNVLRVVIGEGMSDPRTTDQGPRTDHGTSESVVVLECEIDDMNPQIFGVLMDRLLATGALDVFFTSVQMKKNRPGTLVTVLAPPERREALSTIIFSETTTIGVRWHQAERERLERHVQTVHTPFGPARVKIATRAGAIMNVAPEFEDCASLAATAGISVKDVQAAVMKAYSEHKQD